MTLTYLPQSKHDLSILQHNPQNNLSSIHPTLIRIEISQSMIWAVWAQSNGDRGGLRLTERIQQLANTHLYPKLLAVTAKSKGH